MSRCISPYLANFNVVREGIIATCKHMAFTSEIDVQPDELNSDSIVVITVFTIDVIDRDVIYLAPMVVWSSSVSVVFILIKVLLVVGVFSHLAHRKVIEDVGNVVLSENVIRASVYSIDDYFIFLSSEIYEHSISRLEVDRTLTIVTKSVFGTSVTVSAFDVTFDNFLENRGTSANFSVEELVRVGGTPLSAGTFDCIIYFSIKLTNDLPKTIDLDSRGTVSMVDVSSGFMGSSLICHSSSSRVIGIWLPLGFLNHVFVSLTSIYFSLIGRMAAISVGLIVPLSIRHFRRVSFQKERVNQVNQTSNKIRREHIKLVHYVL